MKIIQINHVNSSEKKWREKPQNLWTQKMDLPYNVNITSYRKVTYQ